MNTANLKSLFVTLLAAIGFSSCGEKKATIANETPLAEETSEREVVVFTWEEYFDPEVISQFEEESGIHVRFEYFDSLGALTGELQSQPDAFDVVVVDDVTLLELVDVRMVQKLDRDLVPNLANFDQRYLDQQFDPGNQFSVPYLWGTTLIAVNSEKIPDPEPSWNILWDPKFKGRVALMDEKDDLYASALLSLGLPMDTEDPEHLEAATRRLEDQVTKVKPDFLSLEDIKDRLLAGECDVACLYSGDAAIIAEEDERISYFIPKEGAPLWMDNFVIAKEAGNVKEAHAFINFLSRGDIAAQNANYLWYATPNKAAKSLLSKDLMDDDSVNPPQDVLDRCALHARPSLARIKIMNRGMREIFDWSRAESARVEEAESE